jgi:hypothetical protein
MPTSQPNQISKIVNALIAINPESVLDIGPGFGKYGVLAREYLELWDGRDEYSFKRRMDAVEAFEGYITPLHRYIYNNIYVGDITKVIDELDTSYDLIMMIDVLEHFDKEVGRELLNKMLEKHGGVLVSIPRNVQHQGHAFHNEFEEHKAAWKASELGELAPHIYFPTAASIIVYLTKKHDVSKIKKEQKTKNRYRFFTSNPWLLKLWYLPDKLRGKKSHEEHNHDHSHNHEGHDHQH